MNKFLSIGRLIRDIELRYTQNNTAVLKNTIAIKRNRKNANGEYESDFINISAFGNTAELINKYFKKGDMIGLEGRIETGSYKDKNGNTVYTTDLMVESIDFINSKSKETTQQDFKQEITLSDEDYPF